jgi:phosphoglycolate phosphatase
MKGKFDLIIFDLDGTLVNSIDWIVHCLQTAAEAHGYNAPDEQSAKNTIGLCIQQAMATLFPGIDKKTQDKLSETYSLEFFSQDINEKHLFIGVKDMLSTLKHNKYQLAIATGKTRKGLDWAMQGTGLTGFFDITRSADESASKPQPLMLEQIIQKMNVKKERVVMIGDSVHDIQMANNAGIAAIAVSCGANSEAELKQYNPVLNLSITTELLKFL